MEIMNADGNRTELKLTLGGENSVNVFLLVKTLEGISASYKACVCAQNPEADVDIQVEAFNSGSFEVIMSTLVSVAPTLYPVVQSALPNIKTFLDIVKLKRDLRGSKAENISFDKDKAKVTNHQGEITYHDSQVTNIYINNPNIDKGVTEAFLSLMFDQKRPTLKLTSQDSAVEILQDHFAEMSRQIVEIPVIEEELKYFENEVNANLSIRKPDLLGESQWGFNYDGKSISATIDDKSFLEDVKGGKVEFCAGSKLPVRMKIEVWLDESLTEKNKKYTILSVTGDIIEPSTDYEQIEF